MVLSCSKRISRHMNRAMVPQVMPKLNCPDRASNAQNSMVKFSALVKGEDHNGFT